MKTLREKAMDFLARREHSRVELAQKLRDRMEDVSGLEQVLNKLEADGLLSDERFVEMFVRSRVSQGYGPIRVQKELRLKGVGNELISPHLRQDWCAHLQAAWQKKYGGKAPLDAKTYGQQMRFFLQRGFSAEMIHEVISR